MALIARKVCHVYRKGEPHEALALCGIDVNFEEGELALVAGASGSGKTTLLGCLSGLLRPTSGFVVIDGADAVKARGKAAMSIQFPERALFMPTVYEDVSFGPASMGMSKDETRERVFEAIKAVGLGEELLASRPGALSHGQRRLAALAGVIAVRPRYLFLDEPAAGLDPHGQRRILDALAGLNRNGTAIIIASHNLERLMGICNRILVLDSGRIIFDGRPDEAVLCDDVFKAGLKLPPSMLAAHLLKSRGIDVPWNVSPDIAAGHLRRLKI